MTGSSIFDYVHVQDHQEVTEQLGLNAPQCTAGAQSSEDGSSTPRSVTPSMPERGTKIPHCHIYSSTTSIKEFI